MQPIAFINRCLRRIAVIGLAASLGLLPLWAAEKSKTESTSEYTVDQVDENTTATHQEESFETVTEGRDGVTTVQSGTDIKDTLTTKPHVGLTDNGIAGGAAQGFDAKSTRDYSSGNAGEGDLGSTELVNGKEVAGGSVGYQGAAQIKNEFGTVDAKVNAGASTSLKVGDNGAEVAAEMGLSAELKAISEKMTVGDENFSVSAQAQAKVEALIGAKAKAGFYIDEKGITIGASAEGGAYVKAEAKLSFEANIMGLATTVTVTASGYAGAMGYAEATVTIGFDGRIKFRLGAGLAIGLGASVGIEFDVDASELMKRLNLDSLEQLVEWIEAFRKNPAKFVRQLVEDATTQIIDSFVDQMSLGWLVPGEVRQWAAQGIADLIVPGSGDADEENDTPDDSKADQDPNKPKEEWPDPDDPDDPGRPNPKPGAYDSNQRYDADEQYQQWGKP